MDSKTRLPPTTTKGRLYREITINIVFDSEIFKAKDQACKNNVEAKDSSEIYSFSIETHIR